ncbi:MAG: ferrochelatase [Acidobacteriaceae bacterium]|nr:ferrochelatase [Acidobacteriaceae bacterium]MBV9778467.1 ferrochelatase [Acidobacteriaceae bacterium]
MYNAILIVSFGGPEKAEDVIPFLENVTGGRNIPADRLREVAEHYRHFGGKSPINDQCRALIRALRKELDQHKLNLPIYWGTRNWHPALAETIRQMRDEGIRHALAFVTSAYSSYSSCRQYRENIADARAQVGADAPHIDKLRAFYNHPGFIEASADRVRETLAEFCESEMSNIRFVVSAHSIPSSMAETSDYQRQLRETARLVAEAAGFVKWDLVFQSRSGPPAQPWLGPDILDHLKALHSQGVKGVLLAPLGFLSDHVEILYDLDVEASRLAQELGMKMLRAKTVGTHPAFIGMARQLIAERVLNEPQLAMGAYGPSDDVCPPDCCPAPQQAGRPLVLGDRSASQLP